MYFDIGLQFGFRTEAKSPEEIKQVANKHGVTFTIMSKVDVNGRNSTPIYRHLKSREGCGGDITWSFHSRCEFAPCAGLAVIVSNLGPSNPLLRPLFPP